MNDREFDSPTRFFERHDCGIRWRKRLVTEANMTQCSTVGDCDSCRVDGIVVVFLKSFIGGFNSQSEAIIK